MATGNKVPEAASPTTKDPTLDRLEDQINWYDRCSMNDQQYFKWMKAIVILAAALIPFLSGNPFPYSQWVVGGLGVLIVVIEGLQQLYQFQANWLNYRSTCEALKHKKFCFSPGGALYRSKGCACASGGKD